MKNNLINDQEALLLHDLKVLTEAHRLAPNQYNLSRMSDIIRQLQNAYVARIQNDWKS